MGNQWISRDQSVRPWTVPQYRQNFMVVAVILCSQTEVEISPSPTQVKFQDSILQWVYPPTKALNKIKFVTAIKHSYVFQHWAAILRKLQNKGIYAQH